MFTTRKCTFRRGHQSAAEVAESLARMDDAKLVMAGLAIVLKNMDPDAVTPGLVADEMAKRVGMSFKARE